MRQQSFEIEGLTHGVPIPMASKVGPILMTSGISGKNRKTNVMPEDAEEQATNCFDNLKNVLDQAGMDFGDVVKITVFLVDETVRSAINKPWLAIFPDEHHRPARHALIVPSLRSPMKIQIEAYAVAKGA